MIRGQRDNDIVLVDEISDSVSISGCGAKPGSHENGKGQGVIRVWYTRKKVTNGWPSADATDCIHVGQRLKPLRTIEQTAVLTKDTLPEQCIALSHEEKIPKSVRWEPRCLWTWTFVVMGEADQ